MNQKSNDNIYQWEVVIFPLLTVAIATFKRRLWQENLYTGGRLTTFCAVVHQI